MPVVPVRPNTVKASAPPRRVKLAAWLKPILGAAILFVAASATYLTLSHLHSSPPSAAPDMRTGSIVILAPNMHDCRHLSFDNATGAIKDQGTGQCNDANANAAARLGEVLQHFQDR